MDKMTKARATAVMNAIGDRVKEGAVTFGMTMHPRVSCTWTSVGMTLKFELFVEGGQKEREQNDFAQLAVLYGLKPSDYLRKVTLIGEDYLLVGFRPRSSKRPILFKRIFDGKLFTFPAKSVESLKELTRLTTADIATMVVDGHNTSVPCGECGGRGMHKHWCARRRPGTSQA